LLVLQKSSFHSLLELPRVHWYQCDKEHGKPGKQNHQYSTYKFKLESKHKQCMHRPSYSKKNPRWSTFSQKKQIDNCSSNSELKYQKTFNYNFMWCVTLVLADIAFTAKPKDKRNPKYTCVCIGLKWVNLYRSSYALLPRALSGRGFKSKSSVCVICVCREHMQNSAYDS
jgi:hypothetical protein